MNPVQRPSSFVVLTSFALVTVGLGVLVGCSGSLYSLGNAPDGGPDANPSARPPTDTVTFTDAGTIPPASGTCTTTGAPACSGSATGYTCTASSTPQKGSLVALSCTGGTITGFQTDYCCIPWSGTTETCAPLPKHPCDGYAYQCTPGSFPRSINANLTCGDNFPDTNGNNDFCCALH